MITTDLKKIDLASKLYVFYEAISGDLLFYSVTETLFLTLAKGFTAPQIALLFFISSVADLLLEYPSYLIIRKIGNSRSVAIGGIMPLIAILLISIAPNLAVVTAGNIFFQASGNFQSAACAAERNNLALLGRKDEYTKIFSSANTLYSVLSMAAAVCTPFLFSVNRYIPCIICIAVYISGMVISFFIRDHSDTITNSADTKEQENIYAGKVDISSAMKYLALLFSLSMCSLVIFGNNCELLLSGRLESLFTEKTAVFIFGGIVWASKVIRMSTNMLMPKILYLFKGNILIIGTSAMFVGILLTGLTGVIFKESIICIIIAGCVYAFIKSTVHDSLRTYMKTIAIDINSRKKQQYMLMLLNVGQSVTNIVMRGIVLFVMTIASLEYVFIAFSVIVSAEIVIAFRLKNMLGQNMPLLSIETVLTEGSIDNIAQNVTDVLIDDGIEKKQALCYRMLIEERLIALISSGHKNEKLTITLYAKPDDINVSLSVNEEEIDVFAMPQAVDEVSTTLFSRVFGRLSE